MAVHAPTSTGKMPNCLGCLSTGVKLALSCTVLSYWLFDRAGYSIKVNYGTAQFKLGRKSRVVIPLHEMHVNSLVFTYTSARKTTFLKNDGGYILC